MASAAVQNPVPAGESKSSRKKKAKADAAANGTEQPLADPAQVTQEDSNHAADGDDHKEHPYIRSLNKQLRNLNKKLTALAKSDAVVAENKGISLDELVAQKKLNADQKASLQKKPQIQQQLAELQEQISQYRKFDADYQSQLAKQKAELEEKHDKETAGLRQSLQASDVEAGTKELKSKLLVFSQFLRCAAAKRLDEANQNTPESRAFEGALLYVYGGDDVAVDTALKVIEGSDEMVPSIEDETLGVKCKFAAHTCSRALSRAQLLFLRTAADLAFQSRTSSRSLPPTCHFSPRNSGSTHFRTPTRRLAMPSLPAPTLLSTMPA